MTYIGYRDSLGLVEIEVDIQYGITCNRATGEMYFSDTDGNDYTIRTDELEYIEER